MRSFRKVCVLLLTVLGMAVPTTFPQEFTTIPWTNSDSTDFSDSQMAGGNPTEVTCQPDEIFCIMLERCVKKDGNCYDYDNSYDSHHDSMDGGYHNSVSCGPDEIFCIMSERCVKKDGNCYDNSYDSHHDSMDGGYHNSVSCGPDEIFCIMSERCVKKDGNCYDHDNSYDSHHDSMDGGYHNSVSCGPDEIFCIMSERCVKKDGNCYYNSYDSHHDSMDGGYHNSVSCGPDEIFCIMSERCVKKDGNCYDHDNSYDSYHDSMDGGYHNSVSCGPDEIFCIMSERCVKKDGNCYDHDNSYDSHHDSMDGGYHNSVSCGPDEIFCIMSERCVKRDGNCYDNSYDSHHDSMDGGYHNSVSCGPDEIFCIMSERCVKKDGNCYDYDNSYDSHHDSMDGGYHNSVSCGHDEIFCLMSERCVKKDGNCYDNSYDSHHDSMDGGYHNSVSCGPDEIFCIMSERCVKKDGNCYDYDNSFDSHHDSMDGGYHNSVSCGPDEIFCIMSERCVKKDGNCYDHDNSYDSHHDSMDGGYHNSVSCGPDEIFCIMSERCVKKDGNCFDYDNSYDSHHDSMDGGYHNSVSCGPDEIFCIMSERCVKKDGNCYDHDNSYDSHHDSMDGGYHNSVSCGPDEIFCIMLERCVKKDGNCFDYDNSYDSHDDSMDPDPPEGVSCGFDEIFCIMIERCVKKDGSCSDDNSTSTTEFPTTGNSTDFFTNDTSTGNYTESYTTDSSIQNSTESFMNDTSSGNYTESYTTDSSIQNATDTFMNDTSTGNYTESYTTDSSIQNSTESFMNDTSTGNYTESYTTDSSIQNSTESFMNDTSTGNYTESYTTDSSIQNSTESFMNDTSTGNYTESYTTDSSIQNSTESFMNDTSTGNYTESYTTDSSIQNSTESFMNDTSTGNYTESYTTDSSIQNSTESFMNDTSTGNYTESYTTDSSIQNSTESFMNDTSTGNYTESYTTDSSIRNSTESFMNDTSTGNYTESYTTDSSIQNATESFMNDTSSGNYTESYMTDSSIRTSTESFMNDTSTGNYTESYTTDSSIRNSTESSTTDSSTGNYIESSTTDSSTGKSTESLTTDPSTGKSTESFRTDSSTTDITTSSSSSSTGIPSTDSSTDSSTKSTTIETSTVLTTESTTQPPQTHVFDLPLKPLHTSFSLSSLVSDVVAASIECPSDLTLLDENDNVVSSGSWFSSSDTLKTDHSLSHYPALRTCTVFTDSARGVNRRRRRTTNLGKFYLEFLLVPNDPIHIDALLGNTTLISIAEDSDPYTIDIAQGATFTYPIIEGTSDAKYSTVLEKVEYQSIYGLVASLPLGSFGIALATVKYQDPKSLNWQAVGSSAIAFDLQDEGLIEISLKENYNGQFSLTLEPIGLSTAAAISLTVDVAAVNDAPVLTADASKNMDKLKRTLFFYPYAPDSDVFYSVGEVASAMYKDIDDSSSTISLACLGAQNTIGQWMFQIAGTNTWLDIAEAPSSLSGGSIIDGYLFDPNDQLKFVPQENDLVWKLKEAREKTQLMCLGWTPESVIPTDRRGDIELSTCESKNDLFCGSGGSSQFSVEPMIAYVTRTGCDAVPGSGKKIDQCGKCGGHDDCVDCNGDANGGAIKDCYGNCVGGGTGLSNETHDCGGTCGDFHIFQNEFMEACVSIDFNFTELVSSHCDNDPFSQAVINECGYCTTNPDEGRDACLFCDGHNDSCADCDGVPNGNKVLDVCENCKATTDSTFDRGCQSLGINEPPIFYAEGKIEIVVRGASLTVFTSAECTLASTSGGSLINLETVPDLQNNQLIVSAEVTPNNAGTYTVACVFDGETPLTVDSPEVLIYTRPTIDSISPEQMPFKTGGQISVTGSGFVNTGYMKCLMICDVAQATSGYLTRKFGLDDKVGHMVFPANRESDTEVTCDLSKLEKIKRATKCTVSVLLGAISANTDTSSIAKKSLNIMAAQPQIKSAKLAKSYCFVKLKFNVDVSGPKECDEIFQEPSSFAAGASCEYAGKIIKVKNADILPNAVLTLKPDKIFQDGVSAELATAAIGSATVQESATSLPIKISTNAPQKLGSCDEKEISMFGVNPGCIPVTYSWAVELEDQGSADAAAVSNNLQALNARLSTYTNEKSITLGSTDIPPGSSVRFNFTVSSTSGKASALKTFVIQRDVLLQPIQIYVFLTAMDIENIDPTVSLGFSADIFFSNCVDFEESDLVTKWSISSDFDAIDQYDKNKGTIPANQLRGDQTYEITFSVSLLSNDAVQAATSVPFKTARLPLVPIITGLQDRTVDGTQPILLDASSSYDPNRNPIKANYVWSCTEMIGSIYLPCFVPGTFTTIDLAPSEVVTIPANLLQSGKKYTMTVHMMKDGSVASATVELTVQEEQPPTLTATGTYFFVNPTEKLQLTATVSHPSSLLLYWEVTQPSEDYSDIELNKFLDPYSNNPYYFYVPEASQDLQYPLALMSSEDNRLPEGAKFNLRFTAIALSNSQISYIDFDVKVNSAPIVGDAEVTPESGTSMDTEFRIKLLDGWSDDEGDVLIYYFMRMKIGESTYEQMNAYGEKDVLYYSFQLKTGSYKFAVKVCDGMNLCSFKEIDTVVDVSEPATDVMDGILVTLVIRVQIMVNINDNRALFLLQDTIHIMFYADSMSQAMQQLFYLVQQLMNMIIQNMLNTFIPALDKESSTEALKYSNKGQSNSKGTTTEETMGKSEKTATDIASVYGGGAQRRRKRAASSDPSTPMSVDTAETLLETFSITFNSKGEGNITEESAADYLVVLDSVMIGLCNDLATNSPASHAKSDLTTVRVRKQWTDDLDKTTYTVACDDCADYVVAPATVKYGGTIKSAYYHWVCSDGSKCYGVCLASAQIKYDIHTRSSSIAKATPRTRRSDVVAVKLINYEKSEFIPPIQIEDPVVINIPVIGEINTASYSLQCLVWTGDDWSDSGCVADDRFKQNDTDFISCVCSTYGYVAIFQGEAELPSIPLTASSISITLTFLNDYDTVMNGNEQAFKDHFTTEVSNLLKIASERIRNLKLTRGSVIASFDIATAAGPSLSELVHILQTGVDDGTLRLTTVSGTVLNVQSMTYTFGKAAQTPETEADIAVIVGATIGSLALVLLICVGSYYVYQNGRHDSHSVSPSPEPPEEGDESKPFYKSTMPSVLVSPPKHAGVPMPELLPQGGAANWVESETPLPGKTLGITHSSLETGRISPNYLKEVGLGNIDIDSKMDYTPTPVFPKPFQRMTSIGD
ncbi:hypothetical protein ScPMuIL_000368 [Solemya velum]